MKDMKDRCEHSEGYVDGSLLFLVASHMENKSKGKVRTILKTARKITKRLRVPCPDKGHQDPTVKPDFQNDVCKSS